MIAASDSTDRLKGARLAAACMRPGDILNDLREQMDQEVPVCCCSVLMLPVS